jgi:signal transduction histidine kinase
MNSRRTLRPEKAVKTLERAIATSEEAIAEGRDAIQQLRSSATLTNDIAGAIGVMGEELAAGETNTSAASFALQVEGKTRDVHAIARDEICRVAFEAMRNAFRHAQAGRIEVDLWYDDRQLRLRVRDNGKGIDPKILDADGVAGHWGMRGMRERAKVMGGDLAVWSELNSGTEVELVVPAMIAYQTRSATRTSWFSRKKG